MPHVAQTDRFGDLVVAIEKTGYYPQVVASGVAPPAPVCVA